MDGWHVTLEAPGHGFTDLVAARDNRVVAVEIETGKSDWRANLRKNLQAGFAEILIVTTNSAIQEKIAREASEVKTTATIGVRLAREIG